MSRKAKIRLAILAVLGLLALLTLFRERSRSIESGSTLVLEIGGEYVEAPQPPLLARAMGEGRAPFAKLLSRVATAERDERIGTVVLVIRPLGIGWGKAGELRDAITRLRASGHQTLAYLDIESFSASREYYVATAADEIWVVPGGAVPVIGLAAEYFYLGGLWQKLGVGFEIGKAGKYKSAVEAYAGQGMSEASREMANSLLDDIDHAYRAAIASGRKLSPEEVARAIDRGPITPEELQAAGLVDGTMHLDVLLDELDAPVVHDDEYVDVEPEDVGFDPKLHFALVYGSGTVTSGDSRQPAWARSQTFSPEAVGRALRDAAADDAIDAIILRIDSPGGSALAAEKIWRALQRAKQQGKPIIASFSDVAASGAYYVAAGADAIVASPSALTGSIGVFALRPVLGAALERVGIRLESLRRGRLAGFLLSGEPLSEAAHERLQSVVQSTYRLFLERVAQGRSLDTQAVDKVAQGRVWTGRQALERGLVDELGGLRAAVNRAKRALGVDESVDAELVPYPAPESLGQQIAEALNSRLVQIALDASPLSLPLPRPLGDLRAWMQAMPSEGPLLLPPALVEIR